MMLSTNSSILILKPLSDFSPDFILLTMLLTELLFLIMNYPSASYILMKFQQKPKPFLDCFPVGLKVIIQICFDILLTVWHGTLFYFPFHNLDLFVREAVEFINHLIDLFFVFPDLHLLGGVIQIAGVFGDSEDCF
jgi:hypothetical protein